MGIPVTTTEFTAQAHTRKAVLTALDAAEGGTMFAWPTASAVLDLDRGVLLIAAEADLAPDDWDSVVSLIHLAGFDNGTDGPFTDDPGEATEIMGLHVWSLALGASVS